MFAGSVHRNPIARMVDPSFSAALLLGRGASTDFSRSSILPFRTYEATCLTQMHSLERLKQLISR